MRALLKNFDNEDVGVELNKGNAAFTKEEDLA